MSDRTRLWPSLALSLVVAAAPLAAQQARFGESTDVVEIQVPVNVTGRDGQPVRGLTAADFRVTDDGRPQEIVDFRVIDLDALEAGGGSAAQLPAVARRHFLFLFDFSFSSPTDVLKARLAAREFVLTGLHPTDLAAVATYSHEQGPRLILNFSPDRGQLAHAIDTLGVITDPQAAAVRDPLKLVIRPPDSTTDFESLISNQNRNADVAAAIAETGTEAARVLAKQFERSERSFQRSRIKGWSRSLGDLARMLHSVDGRKHLVYFSAGFDSRLLLGRQPNLADERQVQDNLDIARGAHWMVDTDELHGNSGLQSDIQRMLEEFRRADVVIQAVDIGGLATELDATAAGDHRPGADGLFHIANETGGELFENANDFGRELREVVSRTSITYVLTIRPPKLVADGSYHRLAVDVPGTRGARLSHRSGYYAPRPFAELHPIERALLAADAVASAAPRGQIRLDLLAAPFHAGGGAAYVPVIVEVDGETLLAGEPDEQLAVEIYAYVTNARGEIVDFFSQMVGLELGRARQAVVGSGIKYYGHLDLSPGEYLLRVLVRNADTGRTGLATLPLAVPALDREPHLLPPFFLEEPGKWVMVRERPANPGQESVVYPFVVEGDPYVPAARPALARGEVARMCLVGYNLSPEQVQVEARVVDADGQEVGRARVDGVEQTVTGVARMQRLLATFRPDGLAPGDYALEVAVLDPQTGERRLATAPFAVVR